MNQVMHSLVGYDRETERVAEEFDVPDAALTRAKQLARVLDDDPEAIRCYSLDAAGARDLAALLDAKIDTDRNDYFLEGFAGGDCSARELARERGRSSTVRSASVARPTPALR